MTAQAWRTAFGITAGSPGSSKGGRIDASDLTDCTAGGPGEAPRRAQASTNRQTNPIRG